MWSALDVERDGGDHWSVPYFTPSHFAEDRGATAPDPPVTWQELTDAQFLILFNAGECEVLWDADGAWSWDDEAGERRPGDYLAQLMAAARCLLQWDLLSIVRPVPTSVDGTALPTQEALAVVADPWNWTRQSGEARGWSYELRLSDAGGALGRGAPRDGDSRAVRIWHEMRRIPLQSDLFARLAQHN